MISENAPRLSDDDHRCRNCCRCPCRRGCGPCCCGVVSSSSTTTTGIDRVVDGVVVVVVVGSAIVRCINCKLMRCVCCESCRWKGKTTSLGSQLAFFRWGACHLLLVPC
jgi:hypothetical protein